MNPAEHWVALELAEAETKNPLGAVWHSTDPVPEENFPAGQAVAEVTPAAEDIADTKNPLGAGVHLDSEVLKKLPAVQVLLIGLASTPIL